MLILLEGPDGTFKSTIARRLEECLQIPIVHGSSFESAKRPEPEVFHWYERQLKNLKDAILDRSIYSNLVYTSLYEGYTRISNEHLHRLEELMVKNNEDIILVMCTGFIADLKERLIKRGDPTVRPEELTKVRLGYMKFLGSHLDRLNKDVLTGYILYNSSITTIDQLITEILDKLGGLR